MFQPFDTPESPNQFEPFGAGSRGWGLLCSFVILVGMLGLAGFVAGRSPVAPPAEQAVVTNVRGNPQAHSMSRLPGTSSTQVAPAPVTATAAGAATPTATAPARPPAAAVRIMRREATATPVATAGPVQAGRMTATPSSDSTGELPRLVRLAGMPAVPTEPDAWDAAEPFRFVEETGHNLGLAFKAFYDANGGVAVFGLPLTEVLVDADTGLQVQYFERARLELHPDSAAVTLTRAGAELVEHRTGTAFVPLRSAPADDPAFFAETGYRVSGKFWEYWQEQGGVAIFGYPVSGELIERIGGRGRLVQYFERARLEYYPEYAGSTRSVQVGRIGAQLARYHELPEQMLAPAEPIIQLSSATTSFADSEGTYNATLAARHLHGQVVAPGATLSFLEVLGDISTRSGYTQGAAIVGNRIVPVVAGGICQTSTTLYRAAFQAGIAITERHSHSLYIPAFNDIVSFDAAVFSPGLDLKVANDMPYPLLVTATGDAGLVTVALWGRSDGRSTRMLDPEVRAELAPAVERWRYDPELPPDATARALSSRGGMEVVLGRVVTGVDGEVLHNDRFFTQYDPVAGEVRFGAAVTPPEGVIIEGDLPPTPTPTPSPTEVPPTEVPPTEVVPEEPLPEEPLPENPLPANPLIEEPPPEEPTPEGPLRRARPGS